MLNFKRNKKLSEFKQKDIKGFKKEKNVIFNGNLIILVFNKVERLNSFRYYWNDIFEARIKNF